MSMHLATGCVLIQLWTFQQPPEIQRRNATIIIGGLASFVVYHCVTDEFVLHVIVFLASTLVRNVPVKSLSDIRHLLTFCPWVCKSVGWKTRRTIKERIEDKTEKEILGTLTTFATCMCTGAYPEECMMQYFRINDTLAQALDSSLGASGISTFTSAQHLLTGRGSLGCL